MNHDAETIRERAAYLCWRELMDWCERNRVNPSTQNDLFSICGKIRAMPVEISLDSVTRPPPEAGEKL